MDNTNNDIKTINQYDIDNISKIEYQYENIKNKKVNFYYTNEDIINILNKYKNIHTVIYYDFIINSIVNLFDTFNEFIIYISFNEIYNFIFSFKYEKFYILKNINQICKSIYNKNKNINDIFNSDEYIAFISMYCFYNFNNIFDKFGKYCKDNLNNNIKKHFFNLLK